MNVFFKCRAALAVAAICFASGATAQSWTATLDGPEGLNSASICQPGASGMVCLSLMCAEGQPLGLALQTSQPVAGDVPGRIAVDRGDALEVVFAAPQVAGGPAVAAWDHAEFPGLLNAMKAGSQAFLTFDAGQGEEQTALSLRGSTRALSAVQEACPVPLPRVESPEAIVDEAMVKVCADTGNPLPESGVYRDGLIVREDLDGDGREDAVVMWENAECGYSSYYCGRWGCPITFLHAEEAGGYSAVQETRGYAYQVLPGWPGWKDFNDLRIVAHGDACGGDAMNCEMLYRWTEDGRLKFLAKY